MRVGSRPGGPGGRRRASGRQKKGLKKGTSRVHEGIIMGTTWAQHAPNTLKPRSNHARRLPYSGSWPQCASILAEVFLGRALSRRAPQPAIKPANWPDLRPSFRRARRARPTLLESERLRQHAREGLSLFLLSTPSPSAFPLFAPAKRSNNGLCRRQLRSAEERSQPGEHLKAVHASGQKLSGGSSRRQAIVAPYAGPRCRWRERTLFLGARRGSIVQRT